MKEKYIETKFFCKKGCDCKLCNPHKGGHNKKQLKIMSEEKEAPEAEGETQLEKGLNRSALIALIVVVAAIVSAITLN